MPRSAMRSRAWTIAVVLPKPAGARTSTSLTAPAATIPWHTASRGTWVAVTLGGLSLDDRGPDAADPDDAGEGIGRAGGGVESMTHHSGPAWRWRLGTMGTR